MEGKKPKTGRLEAIQEEEEEDGPGNPEDKTWLK